MTKDVVLNLATATATIAAVIVAGMRIHEFRREKARPVPISTIAEWRRFSEVGARIGPDSAEVVMVEFGDFTCSVCRRAIPYLKAVRRRMPTLAFVYRHFPIAPVAKPAAIAAICAETFDRFEQMHDLLYAQPESLGVRPWSRFALDAGIQDTVRFAECLNGAWARDRLREDSMAAVELDISGTPTFLLNHLKVTGFHGAEKMDSIMGTLRALRRAP